LNCRQHTSETSPRKSHGKQMMFCNLKKNYKYRKTYVVPLIFVSFHTKWISGLVFFPAYTVHLSQKSVKLDFKVIMNDLGEGRLGKVTYVPVKAKYNTEQTVILSLPLELAGRGHI
jgi:hypothetical protein